MKSTGYDLYEDGFPHSTREGFERGCRSAACPGKDDNGYSCVQANLRYNGDYGFRKLVNAGHTPAEITAILAEREQAAQVKPAAPAKPAKPAVTTTDAGKEVTHGTTRGYQLGCRIEEKCPNVALGLPSCLQENRRYHRDWTANRRKNRAEAQQSRPLPSVVLDAPLTAPAEAANPIDGVTVRVVEIGGGVEIVIRFPRETLG